MDKKQARAFAQMVNKTETFKDYNWILVPVAYCESIETYSFAIVHSFITFRGTKQETVEFLVDLHYGYERNNYVRIAHVVEGVCNPDNVETIYKCLNKAFEEFLNK